MNNNPTKKQRHSYLLLELTGLALAFCIIFGGCSTPTQNPAANLNGTASVDSTKTPGGTSVGQVTFQVGTNPAQTPAENKTQSQLTSVLRERSTTVPPGSASESGMYTAVPVYTSTPDNRLPPERWQEWPVIPVVSARAKEIYQKGIAMGNDPHAFSKVGDCQNVKEAFMGIYDLPDRYILPEKEQFLKETIANFSGSFNRDGMTVAGGFNAATELSPMWADPKYCEAGETPLECEFRVHRPSIVIISLERWFQGRTMERYESYMRQIIEYSIAHGVVPILATKADNVEGDNSINLTTAKLAYEYDIPLWNFWLAVQPIANHGMDSIRNDGFHISVEAWNVRSYTALRALDTVWRFSKESSIVVQPTESGEPISTSAVTPVVSATMTPASLTGVDADLSAVGVTGKVIFGLARRTGQVFENLGVFQFDFDKKQMIQILDVGYDIQAVSQDGRQMLVNQGTSLYIADVDGNQLNKVSDKFYPSGKIGAYWLPDGKSIALIDVDNGFSQLDVYNPETDTFTALTKQGDNPIELYPSTDGSRIYWSKGTCSSKWECVRDGTWSTVLAGEQSYEINDIVMPAFSSDGSYFACNTGEDQDKFSLFIATMDRKTNRHVELPGDNLVDYNWSPGSDKLAVLTLMRSDYFGRASAVRVFTVDPQILVIQEFENINGLNARVVWAPDGQNLFLTGTDMTSTGSYLVEFRILNLAKKKMVSLDDMANINTNDFRLTTNLYWIGSNP